MVKKCIYCSAGIDSDSVVDMCRPCMYQVWGEKMAKAIVEGMEKERDAGNLELGKVGESKNFVRENRVEVVKPISACNEPRLEFESVSREELNIFDGSSKEKSVGENISGQSCIGGAESFLS